MDTTLTSTSEQDLVVADEVTETEEKTAAAAEKADDGAANAPADSNVAAADKVLKEYLGGDKPAENGENKPDNPEEKIGEDKKADENGDAAAGDSNTDGKEKEKEANGEDKTEDGDKEGNADEKEDPDKKKPEMVWDGAPEFQWRTVMTAEDRQRLIIENVGVSDMLNPFLYTAIQRAQTVEFKCYVAPKQAQQGSEHNILRRGRLTLIYSTDQRAMSQAINQIVYMRTRVNKRLKIYLPQTPNAMRMRHQLEARLGQVIEPETKQYQLCVRSVPEDCTAEQVKTQLEVTDEDLAEANPIEFKQDGLDRRCAVVTFRDPFKCALVHTFHDELKLNETGKAWAKVFVMNDLNSEKLMHISEMRLHPDKFPNVGSAGGRRQTGGQRAGAKTNAQQAGNKPDGDAAAKDDSAKEGGEATADAEKTGDEDVVVLDATDDAAKPKAAAGKDSNAAKKLGAAAGGPAAKRPASGAQSRGGGPPNKMMRGGAGQRFNNRSPRGGAGPRGGFGGGFQRGGRGMGGPMRGGPGPAMQPRFQPSPWAGGAGGRGGMGGGPMGGRGGGGGGQDTYALQSVLREQQRQLEMQNELLKQQQMINDLQSRLETRGGAGGGYGAQPAAAVYGASTMDARGGRYGAGGYGGGVGAAPQAAAAYPRDRYSDSASYRGGSDYNRYR